MGGHSRSLFKAMAGDSKEAKKLGEEIFKAYRANGTNSLGDESATTMGKAYSRLSGGMLHSCYMGQWVK